MRCLECLKNKREVHLSKQKGSTSHLWNHFKSKHPSLFIQLSATSEDSGQVSIKGFVKNGTTTVFDLDEFHKLVVKWAVDEDIPWKGVESKRLQACFSYLNRRAVLPSSTTLVRKLNSLYHETQLQVRALLAAIPGKYSTSCDLWTAPNRIAFLCITAHWIDADWKLRSCIIGFEEVKGRHTSEALITSFTDVLESPDWDLGVDRLFGVTLDNASSNLRFIQLLAERKQWDSGQGFRCLVHVINLVCQTFLETPEVKVVADIVRKISRYEGAQGSAQRMQAWLHCCEKHLPLDTPTRWSTCHDILKIAVELRDTIPTWRRGLPSAKGRADMEITEAQWDKVVLLLDLLEPFARATDIANQMDQPCSFVLPLYNVKYNELMKKAVDLRYNDFAPAIASGLFVLNEYYSYTTDNLTAATVLDPRANMFFFDSYAVRCGYRSSADAEERVRMELAPYLESVEVVDQAVNSDPDDMLGALRLLLGPVMSSSSTSVKTSFLKVKTSCCGGR